MYIECCVLVNYFLLGEACVGGWLVDRIQVFQWTGVEMTLLKDKVSFHMA